MFMSTAVDYPTEYGQAYLVEECTCPTGYTGISCQVQQHYSIINQTILEEIKEECILLYDVCFVLGGFNINFNITCFLIF